MTIWCQQHYWDTIQWCYMRVKAFQITSNSCVCSTVYSGPWLGECTMDSLQRFNDVESISVTWYHHAYRSLVTSVLTELDTWASGSLVQGICLVWKMNPYEFFLRKYLKQGITISIYRLWLHGLYGHWCSRKAIKLKCLVTHLVQG